jgi:hypothetical protein
MIVEYLIPVVFLCLFSETLQRALEFNLEDVIKHVATCEVAVQLFVRIINTNTKDSLDIVKSIAFFGIVVHAFFLACAVCVVEHRKHQRKMSQINTASAYAF